MQSAPQVSVFVALGAGVLSFVSPCVLPLFPAYLSCITGMSATALHHTATLRQHRQRIMLHALCCIAGFSLILFALGASFSVLGSALRAHLDLLQRRRMIRKHATILTIAVAVVSVLSTIVLAAEFMGTVSSVDDKGMAIIQTTDGKEHKAQIAGVKVGDKVDCHVEGGKTSCHKLGPKHK